jgi:hypothetical protein
MGRLIPAGTGIGEYTSLQIVPDGPPPMEEVPPEEAIEAEAELDTDRFAEMIRAAAAAAAGSEPGQTG